MVKPGGTGKPRLAISARLAPLPPSRSRRPALPSALPSPKVNTHLPDFTAPDAGLLAADLLAALGAGLGGPFFRGLRAVAGGGRFFRAWRAVPGGAAFARAGPDGFDFAAIFFDLAPALAMTADIRDGERRCAPYTTFGRFRARREARLIVTVKAT